jgi:hypothetical protein
MVFQLIELGSKYPELICSHFSRGIRHDKQNALALVIRGRTGLVHELADLIPSDGRTGHRENLATHIAPRGFRDRSGGAFASPRVMFGVSLNRVFRRGAGNCTRGLVGANALLPKRFGAAKIKIDEGSGKESLLWRF